MRMNKPRKTSAEVTPVRDRFTEEIESIVHGTHADPFGILGPHWIKHGGKPSLAIRAFRPGATAVNIVWTADESVRPAAQIHSDGVFEAILPPNLPDMREGQPP